MAVRVTWPTARPVSSDGVSVENAAIEVSLTDHVASGRGRPCSSTVVNCLLSPTNMLAPEGVICSEPGAGKLPVRVR